MEKLKPSHDLEAFKQAFARYLAMTRVAVQGARALGYDRDDVGRILQKLTKADFRKSMTSFGDHRQWQDVYHLENDGQVIYVKFTDRMITEFIVLSFKRK